MDLDGYFEKVNEAVNACISRCLSVQDYVVDLTRDEPEIAKNNWSKKATPYSAG